MNAFSRRGACPALSAPMQTGDGLLVRLNPAAAGLSPRALIGLCEAALRHGNGVVEVTARGSLQIRGLTEVSAPLLASEVEALGVPVRTGVPVETGALAGLDPAEIADPTPLVERIRTAIESAGLAGRLGPKVSVVLDGGGRSGLEKVAADVRLTAKRCEAGVLWRLSLAGDAETAKPLSLFSEEMACDATIAVLEAIAALGLAARARDLPAALLEELRSSESLEDAAERQAANNPTLLDILSLRDSRHALGVALPFGHTHAETLIGFAQQAEALEVSDIRFAPKRTILALCSASASALALRQHAERLGFVVDPSDPRIRIAACSGAPACASGHIAARDLAAEIASSNKDLFDDSLTLHISGCGKGCAQGAAASLTLVGSENGAGIVVGGTAKDLPVAYTAHDGVADAFARVADLIGAARAPDETAAGWVARLGKIRIAETFRQG